MLLNLHVKNLALIRECEVEFGEGLNILTGETGTGKSILLGSVQLALGGKMTGGLIREDADYGLVELLFSVEDDRVAARLEEMEIYPEEGEVLLSRRVTGSRSVCRINGETCTMARMRQAAAYLLDIHGQHEHQSLLNRKKQLEILDDFGKEEIAPARDEVRALYRSYTELKKELSEQSMDEEQRKRELSFLEFEIQEIEAANLVPGEDEELESQYRRMSNSRKIIDSLREAHELTGYDGAASAGELVGRAIRCVSSVSEYDPEIASLESLLSDIDGLLNDFNRGISGYMEDLTFEEEDFYRLEQRLDLLNNLKGKYGSTIPRVLEYADRQRERLEYLNNYAENRKQLESRLDGLRQKLAEACGALGQLRREYACRLEKAIIWELDDLNFADVRFEIHFEQLDHFTPDGRDDVEYRISTNPGEPLKPLGRIASGGELSRIMLAIKTILAVQDEVETLIFDEIDAGISGRTAQKVSEKMARIGRDRQVLCITHLPQIASMADVHFLITKSVEGEQTVTRIDRLGAEESVRELARMLGGARITDAVLENAREMKQLAQQQKEAFSNL